MLLLLLLLLPERGRSKKGPGLKTGAWPSEEDIFPRRWMAKLQRRAATGQAPHKKNNYEQERGEPGRRDRADLQVGKPNPDPWPPLRKQLGKTEGVEKSNKGRRDKGSKHN